MCALGLVLLGTTAAAEPAERSFAAVARAIAPAVVRLDVAGNGREITASGVVLDTRGNVLTTGRSFDGAGTGASVQVTLTDGRRLPAEMVGMDPATDVAVVRLMAPPNDLSAARFGDSDDATVGDWVLSVGRAPGTEQSFAAGIISARSPGDLLLTDAQVRVGDAGGALVDLEGQVVGLTTLIGGGAGGGHGRALPINRVRRVAQAIVMEGHASHPFIGVALRERGAEGAVVTRVGRDTPAARAGLRPGDVITAVGGLDAPAPAELVTLIERQPIGARVAVAFTRGGHDHRVIVSVEDINLMSGAALGL